jgi:hypothetical protein
MDLINSVVHNNTAYFFVGSKINGSYSTLLFYQVSTYGPTWSLTDNYTLSYEGQEIIDAQFFIDVEAANASVLLVLLHDPITDEYQLKFSRVAPYSNFNYMTWT